ncbi:hypothetical protein CIB48_g7326 [Xylaria polymorpha]|nr:hypothetical protein CIB48_g7326 [Xylaria polymorpha]
MVPGQNSGKPDLEQGYVSKRTTISPATDQNIDQIDYAVGKPAKPQGISEKTSIDIYEAASTEPIPYSGSLCRASIDSHDGNITIPWVPKGTCIGKENPASLGATSPVRCSIESSDPLEGHLGSFNDDSQPPKPLADGDPGTWAIGHHKDNLIGNIKKNPTRSSILGCIWKRWRDAKSGSKASDEWQRPDEENDLRVSLAELQRIRLRKLQCQLVKHVAYMKTTGEESENWENDLETYIKAVQDYDYMTSRSKLPRDPFYVTGERYIDSYVLHSLLGDARKDITGKSIPVDTPWEHTGEPIGGTRNYMMAKSENAEFRKRIAIAAVAGFFLLGPMWLMVLHNTLYTCLVSTTISVTVFGFILAYSLDSPKEVMSGTAAYAAVLVVFVGVGQT